MAGADYYGCDVCGAKTFYDAGVWITNPTCAGSRRIQTPASRGPVAWGIWLCCALIAPRRTGLR